MASNIIHPLNQINMSYTGGGGRVKPLTNAKFYFGTYDGDPKIDPIIVQSKDEGGTVETQTQPISTNMSGHFVDKNGKLIELFSDQIGYSVLAEDANGQPAYGPARVGDQGNVTDAIAGLTNLQAASVADMIAGISIDSSVVPAKINQYWSSGGTKWVRTGLGSTISDFKPRSELFVEDFGGFKNLPNDSSQAISDAIDVAFSTGAILNGNGGVYVCENVDKTQTSSISIKEIAFKQKTALTHCVKFTGADVIKLDKVSAVGLGTDYDDVYNPASIGLWFVQCNEVRGDILTGSAFGWSCFEIDSCGYVALQDVKTSGPSGIPTGANNNYGVNVYDCDHVEINGGKGEFHAFAIKETRCKHVNIGPYDLRNIKQHGIYSEPFDYVNIHDITYENVAYSPVKIQIQNSTVSPSGLHRGVKVDGVVGDNCDQAAVIVNGASGTQTDKFQNASVSNVIAGGRCAAAVYLERVQNPNVSDIYGENSASYGVFAAEISGIGSFKDISIDGSDFATLVLQSGTGIHTVADITGNSANRDNKGGTTSERTAAYAFNSTDGMTVKASQLNQVSTGSDCAFSIFCNAELWLGDVDVDENKELRVLTGKLKAIGNGRRRIPEPYPDDAGVPIFGTIGRVMSSRTVPPTSGKFWKNDIVQNILGSAIGDIDYVRCTSTGEFGSGIDPVFLSVKYT